MSKHSNQVHTRISLAPLLAGALAYFAEREAGGGRVEVSAAVARLLRQELERQFPCSWDGLVAVAGSPGEGTPEERGERVLEALRERARRTYGTPPSPEDKTPCPSRSSEPVDNVA